ncbi:phosphotransferase [Spirosoma areae]
MEQPTSKEVKSFQQQVSLVELKNGNQAYIKKIVSDYSWWTFEHTDVFQRELTSYQLLTSFNLVPPLLVVDQVNKQFTIEAMITLRPKDQQIQPFLASLINLLRTLKSIAGQEFQVCSWQHLLNLYCKKGQVAQVSPWLLDEMVAIVSKWANYESYPISYVHGDLHFGNLLYDGKSVKLIDFEEAIQSHSIMDATSLSWDVLDCFGQEAYDRFKRLYRNAFQAELIELREWKRFCQLRDWIVGRYLATCCPQEVKQQAYQFIVATEPMPAV